MQADCGKHALVLPPRRGPHPIDAARGTHGQVLLVHVYLSLFQLSLYSVWVPLSLYGHAEGLHYRRRSVWGIESTARFFISRASLEQQPLSKSISLAAVTATASSLAATCDVLTKPIYSRENPAVCVLR